jgi:hypothetical protein
LPNCPECLHRGKESIYELHAEDEDQDAVRELIDQIEFPMKIDATKHFICKKCGLYATREQISDIREKLNRRAETREDKQYEYLEWWQKSKKEKQKI